MVSAARGVQGWRVGEHAGVSHVPLDKREITMSVKHTYFIVLAALAACDGSGVTTTSDHLEPGPNQSTFSIAVAPWEVDSLASAACYDIDVTGPDGAEVWSATQVCTGDFSLGNAGVLSYVGLCEADGDGINTVRIALTSLTADDGTELGNWSSERPPTYTEDFSCTRNADTVVRANFVVMTEGTKGFLDAQVTVREIACNAKIDCNADLVGDDFTDCVADGNGDGDTDDAGIDDPTCMPPVGTIIVALACESAGAEFTQLMLDDIALTCTDAEGFRVDVAVDGSIGLGVMDGFPNGFVTGAIGHAGVSADGTSFWTLQIGVQSGWSDCYLSTRMGASDGTDTSGNDQYPIIAATNIGFGFDTAGVFSCDANPLDGETSGLFSTWGSVDDEGFTACLGEDGTVGLCD